MVNPKLWKRLIDTGSEITLRDDTHISKIEYITSSTVQSETIRSLFFNQSHKLYEKFYRKVYLFLSQHIKRSLSKELLLKKDIICTK